MCDYYLFYLYLYLLCFSFVFFISIRFYVYIYLLFYETLERYTGKTLERYTGKECLRAGSVFAQPSRYAGSRGRRAGAYALMARLTGRPVGPLSEP